jgi:hypothetical protein
MHYGITHVWPTVIETAVAMREVLPHPNFMMPVASFLSGHHLLLHFTNY